MRAVRSIGLVHIGVLFVLLVAASCTDDRLLVPSDAPRPNPQIVDAVHNLGNPHFYFLPPLVPMPGYTGTPDGSHSPEVTVCEWLGSACGTEIARFTMQSGTGAQVVRYDAGAGQYLVNWNTRVCITGPCDLDGNKTYRLRVLVAGTELGYADVDVVESGSQLRNVNTQEYIPLLDGRTLPIKFRIEQGAVVTSWIAKAPMPTPRTLLGVGAVNGVLYAVGGYNAGSSVATLEAYDPATDTWTSRASMPTPRLGVSVGVVNGVLYAVGGYSGGGSTSALATVEAYDPTTDSWTSRAPMPTARAGVGIGVINGVLYAVGGLTNPQVGSSAVGTVEAYDPTTGSWTTRTPMPTPRFGMAVGVINGVLYAAGELENSGLGTTEAYDPGTDSWTTKASMLTSRYRMGGGVVNGVLYAVGGQNSGVGGGITEAYNPTTNSWTTSSPMLTYRVWMGVGVINGVLYAVGGQDPMGPPLAANESYSP